MNEINSLIVRAERICKEWPSRRRKGMTQSEIDDTYAELSRIILLLVRAYDEDKVVLMRHIQYEILDFMLAEDDHIDWSY